MLLVSVFKESVMLTGLVTSATTGSGALSFILALSLQALNNIIKENSDKIVFIIFDQMVYLVKHMH